MKNSAIIIALFALCACGQQDDTALDEHQLNGSWRLQVRQIQNTCPDLSSMTPFGKGVSEWRIEDGALEIVASDRRSSLRHFSMDHERLFSQSMQEEYEGCVVEAASQLLIGQMEPTMFRANYRLDYRHNQAASCSELLEVDMNQCAIVYDLEGRRH
ncbi:MAG: hypothetical protein QGI45_16980 [Myxococcota bacterium]|jgi:hypothetical protein|nr:hypothetical protein [Myxococcota bacterium]